jgi:hypothetical protein
MNSGTTLGHEPADGRVGGFRLEELDEGVARCKSGNRRSVGVVERHFGKSEDIAVERQYLVEGSNRNTNVRDSSPASGGWLAHGARDV